MLRLTLSLSVLCLVLLMQNITSANTKRVALIIGNSAYNHEKLTALSNPVGDAQLMQKTLRQVGFQTTLLTDATRRQMKQAISTFGQQLQKGDVGLFYYAGHGIQSMGRNYLIPIKANIETAAQLEYDAVDMGRVLNAMKYANNGLNIVVLDACRDNPLSETFRGGKRIGAGLTQPSNVPQGTLVAYSTSPGQVAADGRGNHSPYSLALAKAITESGQPLELTFKQVLKTVKQNTQGKQIPWFNSSVEGDFYFKPGKKKKQSVIPPTVGDSVVASQQEIEFWRSVERDGSQAMYRLYLTKYPKGEYVEIARIKVESKMQWGKLIIRSNVYNDMVTINGESQGSTKLDLNLKPGFYELEVSKAGYDTYEQRLEIKAGIEQVLYAKLKKTPPSIPTNIQSSAVTRTIQDSVTGMELIKIPSGCFQMGSDKGPGDEKPVHRVCLSDDYYLGKYEVTQGQWQTIMGTNPSTFKTGKNHPVENVSWNDVQSFIRKLNHETGHNYRLPTEAEWEYACRSGGKEQKYCGSDAASSVAWYLESHKNGHHRVGTKSPNGLGLYDMSGNVWEWVADWYKKDYYKSSPGNDPTGPSGGSYRGIRGGSWYDAAGVLRSASRIRSEPSEHNSYLGFRLARSL